MHVKVKSHLISPCSTLFLGCLSPFIHALGTQPFVLCRLIEVFIEYVYALLDLLRNLSSVADMAVALVVSLQGGLIRLVVDLILIRYVPKGNVVVDGISVILIR